MCAFVLGLLLCSDGALNESLRRNDRREGDRPTLSFSRLLSFFPFSVWCNTAFYLPLIVSVIELSIESLNKGEKRNRERRFFSEKQEGYFGGSLFIFNFCGGLRWGSRNWRYFPEFGNFGRVPTLLSVQILDRAGNWVFSILSS